MDASLDRLTNRLTIWFLFLFNKICDAYEYLYDWIMRLRKCINDVQMRDKWIFLNSNSLPLRVKEDFDTSSYSLRTRVFYPDTRQFFLHSNEGRERNRFDIVDAVIEKDDGNINITEFMMSLAWTSEQCSPSLFEVVLLSTLFTQTPEPVSKMERWRFIVMDSNGNTHEIHLNSARAKERFRTW